MAEINLLPWRERLREERKREFFVLLGGIVIIAAGLEFLVDRYYRGELDDQQARNELIEQQIAVMDQRLSEISQLQEQKEQIRSRMEVIQNLQGSRPVIVYVFDELVRTLPEDVYYSSLERNGDRLSIEGMAPDNNSVSELMRRLDDSQWFLDPGLQQIAATEAPSMPDGQGNSFSLVLSIGGPEENRQAAEEGE